MYIYLGAITIYDASIVRFAELGRLGNSCARKLDQTSGSSSYSTVSARSGTRSNSIVSMPFEAQIRTAQVQAKIKYNFYVTDIYGDYTANFSIIHMNGSLEADLADEYLTVAQFNITNSQVVGDSIVLGYVPKWILDWVRSYFDNDNTEMYQQLAKQLLQREADHFRHFDMVRKMLQQQQQLPLPTIINNGNTGGVNTSRGSPGIIAGGGGLVVTPTTGGGQHTTSEEDEINGL